MQVRNGWTGEVTPGRWSKVDVTADESDLRRVLIEAGLSLDLTASMTTAQVWTILDAEAERFVLLALVAREGYPLAEAKPKIEAASARKAAVLKALSAD